MYVTNTLGMARVYIQQQQHHQNVCRLYSLSCSLKRRRFSLSLDFLRYCRISYRNDVWNVRDSGSRQISKAPANHTQTHTHRSVAVCAYKSTCVYAHMHLIQMVCRWLWWWLYDANDDFLLSEWASECICFVEFVFGVIFNTWHLCCMHKHKAHAWDVDGAKSWEESAGGRDYVRHWFEMSMFLLLLQLSLLACAAFTTAQIRVFHYCFFISLIHFSLLVRLVPANTQNNFIYAS